MMTEETEEEEEEEEGEEEEGEEKVDMRDGGRRKVLEKDDGVREDKRRST